VSNIQAIYSRMYGFRASHVRTFAMALACGLAIANVYYNQPLLALMRASYPGQDAINFIPTATQFGYAIGLFCLVPLGDIVPRRHLIVVQFIALALALVVFASAGSVGALIVAAVVMGFVATVSQQVLPLAASLAQPEARGAAVGAVMSGLLAGILFSRTLAGFVGTHLGWRTMFWISAPLALLGAVIMLVVLPLKKPDSPLRYLQAERSLLTLWNEEPLLRRASIVQGLIFGSFLTFWTILSLHLREPAFDRGADVAGAFGIIGVFGIIAAPLTGRLADRRGAHPVIVVGAVLTLLSWAVFAIWNTIAGLIVGVLVMDIGIQAALISNQQVIFALRPDARNRCNTVFMTSVFLGGTIGSTGAAFAYSHGGWMGTCVFGAALPLAALLIQMAGRNHKRLHPE
jgi:predicted MFS family arabinose efflux permease